MSMLLSMQGYPQNLDLPSDVLEEIQELQKELEEGDITKKGFDKKLNKLLQNYLPKQEEEIAQSDSPMYIESDNDIIKVNSPKLKNGPMDFPINQSIYSNINNNNYDTTELVIHDPVHEVGKNLSNLNIKPQAALQQFEDKIYNPSTTNSFFNQIDEINPSYIGNEGGNNGHHDRYPNNHLYQDEGNYLNHSTIAKPKEAKLLDQPYNNYHENQIVEKNKYFEPSIKSNREQSYNSYYDQQPVENNAYFEPSVKPNRDQHNQEYSSKNSIKSNSRYRSGEDISMHNNYGGFGQTTTKLEVITKPTYSNNPSRISPTYSNSNANNAMNNLTTESKFRTMPRGTSEGIRFEKPYKPNSHQRHHSGVSEMDRYNQGNNRNEPRRPVTHFHSIDESPIYPRNMQHTRSESYAQHHSPGGYRNSDKMDYGGSREMSNNRYSEQGSYGIGSSQSYEKVGNFDIDYESSRNSYDVGRGRRRNSITSSHNSIGSREASSSYYGYNENKPLSNYPNVIGVLNHRSLNTPKAIAYTVIDSKGKEASSLSWEKFHFLVERYYSLLINKKGVRYPSGSRIGLFFRKVEISEFLAAVFGCFIAGLVAVPIVVTETLDDLMYILNDSGSVAVLSTETNYKSISKGGSSNADNWTNKFEWLRPSETITQTFKKKRLIAFKDPAALSDLAMIEYSKDISGELKGIGISHRTIMAQCQSFREFLPLRSSLANTKYPERSPLPNGSSYSNNPNLPVQTSHSGNKNLVIGIEPRAHLGLLLGGFIAPFCGLHAIYVSSAIFDLPQGFLNCLSKYKAHYTVVDYSGLKKTILYHQGNPTRNPDSQALDSLEMLMIDSLVPDTSADRDLVQNFLNPFGCKDPWDVLAPVCSLTNHGGMIVSIGEPRNQDHSDIEIDPRLLYLDREILSLQRIRQYEANQLPAEIITNKVDPHVLKTTSFGNLMPEVTVIIVNPIDNTVCSPDMVGEIWVDSPALSGGYWNMPTLTATEFRATAFFPDTLQPLEGEFLRTGLSGSLVDQQLVIFGWLNQLIHTQDLISSHSPGSQHSIQDTRIPTITINYSEDITNTILNTINKVEDCTIFEVTSRGLPACVVGAETKVTDKEALSLISSSIRKNCTEFHKINPFIVLLVKPGTLPRRFRNGIEIINYHRTRKLLLSGELPILFTTIHSNISSSHDSLLSYDEEDAYYKIAQHTGMEIIPPAIDERFGSDLEGFKSITQLLQWRSTAMGSDPAFSIVDTKGKESKSLSFSKINMKVLTLAHYLVTQKIPAQSPILILMPPGLDYLTSVHAALAANMVVIPYWDFDNTRIKEEILTLQKLIIDFKIKLILVNPVTEERLKNKGIQAMFKNKPGFVLPPLVNVTKIPKSKARLEGLYTGVLGVLVLLYFSADMERQCISFNAPSLLHQCKLHKYELGLTASRPLVTCARVYNGIGFLHFALLGIYVGCHTIHFDQSDFAYSPKSWFNLIGNNGCVASYATPPMIKHATTSISQSEFQNYPLSRLRCLLIPMESRPDESIIQLAMTLTLGSKLDSSAFAQSYTTPFHTLISHRAHLGQASLELNLHFPSLRMGRVRPLEDNEPGLRILDSGRISRDTMVAIVNPVTSTVCQLNEIGEIWISSDSVSDGLYFPSNEFEASRFGAQIQGGDPSLFYVRTGDLGFLYPDIRHDTRPIEEIIATSPLLYVLGPMDQTFDVDGISHFTFDVEQSIEACHSQIVSGGAMIGLLDAERILLMVEIKNNHPGALEPERCQMLTPLIINCVLEQHNFKLDTVAYFSPSTLTRSRLGEKSRILSLAAFKNGDIKPITIYQTMEMEDSLKNYT
ncbi:acetyl-CoA synthetase-like protein [Neoconidiobolus thromboides FSU 785]|nr:acetyl-CoA synthetase-like protein [Neoconidiobolus thromboides FSU 785]